MTSSKLKIYGSDGHIGAGNWIIAQGFEPTDDIRDADVVVFGGGQDIDTAFYGEPKGYHTGGKTRRDQIEQNDFEIARRLGKKMVGICRGAQLLCALSGGKLIQHVAGHGGRDHGISTFDRQPPLVVNSIHHQMMYPYTLPTKDYKILGWATRPLSNTYLNGWNKEQWLPNSFKECEIVEFRNTNSLAIQFHPEMMYRSASYETTNNWLNDLFQKFINNSI